MARASLGLPSYSYGWAKMHTTASSVRRRQQRRGQPRLKTKKGGLHELKRSLWKNRASLWGGLAGGALDQAATFQSLSWIQHLRSLSLRHHAHGPLAERLMHMGHWSCLFDHFRLSGSDALPKWRRPAPPTSKCSSETCGDTTSMFYYSLCPGCRNHSSRGRLIQNKPLQAELLNGLGEDAHEFGVQTGSAVTWLTIRQGGGVLHGVHSILHIRGCQWHIIISKILCGNSKKGPTCWHLMRDAGRKKEHPLAVGRVRFAGSKSAWAH